jgi:hypothetical protein
MPHEGIEGTVALFFYHDRRSRWIGDGLATYAGYIVAREYTPQVTKERLNYYRQQVANLLERGQVTYNLIKDFPVMSLEASGGKDPEVQRAGYVVSLAFWLGIAQRHGEETIRKFWGQGKHFFQEVVYSLRADLLWRGGCAKSRAYLERADGRRHLGQAPKDGPARGTVHPRAGCRRTVRTAEPPCT